MYCPTEMGRQTPLRWSHGFERYRLIAIDTIGDGSCFFHALLNGFYLPYRLQSLDGVYVNRQDLVRNLRNQLANRLGEPIDPLYPTGPTFYEKLSRGHLYELSQSWDQYSLTNMQNLLRSHESVGNQYNEFVSDQLDKDIYILNAHSQDVQLLEDDPDLFYKHRESLILLYHPSPSVEGVDMGVGHYELVGLQDGAGRVHTLFDPDHPLIVFLQQRMREVRRLTRGQRPVSADF